MQNYHLVSLLISLNMLSNITFVHPRQKRGLDCPQVFLAYRPLVLQELEIRWPNDLRADGSIYGDDDFKLQSSSRDAYLWH